jgi:replicative DNA helicase
MQSRFSNQAAEQTILGTIIYNNAYLIRIADILEEKHFYFPEHQAIWRHFVDVANEAVADQVTLNSFFAADEEIKKVGGANYLAGLLGAASSIVDIRDYAKTVIQLWQKRELETLLTRSLEELEGKKFDFISANLENEIAGLAIKEPKKKTQHIRDLLKEMDDDQASGLSSKFVPTGFKKLDEMLNGGIHAQQLVIIGARPSVGKSSICQNVILNASKAGKKCLFISLEVDKRNVTLKFLSDLASVETYKIRNNWLSKVESEFLQKAKSQLREMEIYTNDSSYLRISQIGQIIKSQLDKQPVDLVVVDYVQIIRGDDVKNKNEALVIKENTTALKAFAKQFDVAMLALAQINRKAVEGAKQEPTINDFKGSGGIEEDADVAIILHRDRNEGDVKDNYFSQNGKLIVAKNRHGKTGEISIRFEGDFGRFTQNENTNF